MNNQDRRSQDQNIRILQHINTAFIVFTIGSALTFLTVIYDLHSVAIAETRTAPDFLCFWLAARTAITGHVVALYDWGQLLPMMKQAVGQNFEGFLPWKYPPSMLLLLAPLAGFSQPVAHTIWASVTLAAFLAVIFRIAGRNAAIAAVAAPLTAPEIIMGQNGFATAALLGGVLLLAKHRPFQAGLLAGILSCKPQLFMLPALMVVVRCGWRGVAGILAAVSLLLIVSASIFGIEAWQAFFQSLQRNTAAFGQGEVPWSALQSLYALARAIGLHSGVAAIMQAALIIWTLFFVVRLEWRDVRPDLRNAAVCAATILVTPFLLVWDLTTLAIGMAFFVRAVNAGKLQTIEIAGLFWLAISIQVFLTWGITVGYLDGIVLILMVERRSRCKSYRENHLSSHHPCLKTAFEVQPES